MNDNDWEAMIINCLVFEIITQLLLIELFVFFPKEKTQRLSNIEKSL